jgi:nucleoside-diphosphate-sugar epimerase
MSKTTADKTKKKPSKSTDAANLTVLVTGGSGFIGSHALVQLLATGYRVHTTVRNLKREKEVREILKMAGAEPGDRLTFFAADLEKDAGWADAVAGCEYVLHVASPFPAGVPKNADELIIPARDGALRVLRASRDAKVKRVVLTSSFAAIGYGHPPRKTPFTEKNWTNLDDVTAPYVKSKTIAELAAWDFMAKEGGTLELSVVNPVGVFGPVLSPNLSTSTLIIKMMMDAALPGLPNIYFGAVDVRDVVDLHLRAMTDPAAKGERFLAVAGECVSMSDVAQILKTRMGKAAKKVPTRKLPDWLLRIAAVFDPAARLALPELGNIKQASHEKATSVLNWSPRTNEECIIATAESLVRLGLLK